MISKDNTLFLNLLGRSFKVILNLQICGIQHSFSIQRHRTEIRIIKSLKLVILNLAILLLFHKKYIDKIWLPIINAASYFQNQRRILSYKSIFTLFRAIQNRSRTATQFNYFSLFINCEGHFFLIRFFSLFSINNFDTGLITKHETQETTVRSLHCVS